MVKCSFSCKAKKVMVTHHSVEVKEEGSGQMCDQQLSPASTVLRWLHRQCCYLTHHLHLLLQLFACSSSSAVVLISSSPLALALLPHTLLLQVQRALSRMRKAEEEAERAREEEERQEREAEEASRRYSGSASLLMPSCSYARDSRRETRTYIAQCSSAVSTRKPWRGRKRSIFFFPKYYRFRRFDLICLRLGSEDGFVDACVEEKCTTPHYSSAPRVMPVRSSRIHRHLAGNRRSPSVPDDFTTTEVYRDHDYMPCPHADVPYRFSMLPLCTRR